MKLRTEIDIPKSSWNITHEMKGISIGSCFTNNIGNKLTDVKFPLLVNPFGTVYNPISISHCFDLLFNNQTVTKEQLRLQSGIWSSFKLHSSFSAVTPDEVVSKFQNELSVFENSYKDFDYVIITLGTSWVYSFNETQEIVSNCHKFSSKEFTRYRLSVEEIEVVLSELFETILNKNPDCKIITTISPIRHWKDGAHENQLSKAHLFVALENVMSEYYQVEYFPAYELLQDDLRDYRFYEEDLLHPNSLAVDYISNAFFKTFVSQASRDLASKIKEIQKAKNHKPYHPNSDEFKHFKKSYLEKAQKLQLENPHLNFSEEIKAFLND